MNASNISTTIPGACLLFSDAMNDHLQLTEDALLALGADYYVAGIVENLNLFPACPSFSIWMKRLMF